MVKVIIISLYNLVEASAYMHVSTQIQLSRVVVPPPIGDSELWNESPVTLRLM